MEKTIDNIFNAIEARLTIYASDYFTRYTAVTCDTLFETVDKFVNGFSNDEVISKTNHLLQIIKKIKQKGKSVVSNVTTDDLHSMKNLHGYFKYQDDVLSQLNFEVAYIETRLKKIEETIIHRRTNKNQLKRNINTSIPQAAPTPSKNPDKENQEIINEHLSVFSGKNLQQKKIMPDKEFKLLVSHVMSLVAHHKLPSNIKPFGKIGLPAGHIRYVFYKLHDALFGTNTINQEWIEFLHKSFSQFQGFSKGTTKTKFSVRPASFDEDMKKMLR